MRLAVIGFLILILGSCVRDEQNKAQIETYFNLKSYFKSEANRLNKLHLHVDKAVAIDGETERKQIQINDFKNELSIFIDADINKASWRGEFTVKKEGEAELYTTKNEKIPVKNVEIRYQKNKLKSIQILVITKNILYVSSDILTYFPDSLYEIKKTQKIKLLKEKRYSVIGRFILNSQSVPLHTPSNL